MSLGARIEAIRKEKKLSRPKLAEMMNVAPNSVWRWESGEREPEVETLRKLASVLGVSVAYLMGEGEHPRVNTNGNAIDNEVIPVYPIPVFDISDFREGYPVKEQAKGVTYFTQALMGPVDDGQPPFALPVQVEPSRIRGHIGRPSDSGESGHALRERQALLHPLQRRAYGAPGLP